MAMLPIALLGGAAIFIVPRVNACYAETPDDTAGSNDMRSANIETMREYGANASVWKAQLQKQYLMGTTVHNAEGIHTSMNPRGYNPRATRGDPIELIFQAHAGLNDFDRQDTMLSLATGRGEVRPSRSHAIATTLTPELVHPNNPNQRSALLATTYVPQRAHHAQILAAQRVVAVDDPERSQRRPTGTEFFARAPFQSFRYSM